MRRTAAACTAVLLGLAGAAVPALSASAHTPQAHLTCETATVSLTNYDAGATAKVVLDGETLLDGEFGGNWTLDPAAFDTTLDEHSLEVTVDSTDDTYNYASGPLHVKDCLPDEEPPAEEPPVEEPPAPVEHKEVGLYIYPKVDPAKPASWENSGRQWFCDSEPGDQWFSTVTCQLPPEVCGPGWGFQQDKVKWTGDPASYAWPANIERATNEGALTGLYGSLHGELSTLTHVPPCPEPDKPVTHVDHPKFEDICGPADEAGYELTVPANTESVTYTTTVDKDANTIHVVATANAGYKFGPGVKHTEWKYTYTDEQCPPVQDASASVAVTPATCEVDGTATFSIANATWADPADVTDGSRVAIADAGHAFAGGATELTVTYALQKKFSAAACGELPTLSLPDQQLPTLAHTGASTETPWLGVAGLSLLGLGILASIGAAVRRSSMS